MEKKNSIKTGILSKISVLTAGYMIFGQSVFAAGGGSAGIWADLIAWLKQFETGLMILFVTIMVISLIVTLIKFAGQQDPVQLIKSLIMIAMVAFIGIKAREMIDSVTAGASMEVMQQTENEKATKETHNELLKKEVKIAEK
ncbi:hypothetical protein [Sebaldella termitidis]|uniref:hypothetical protein n=1 Tax=Sebaldella termitidis TaxID=826 RepID=UPI003EBA01EB